MTRLRVLHLVGIDDSDQVHVEVLRAPPGHSKYRYLGNVEISGLLDAGEFDVRQLVCGGMQGEEISLRGYHVVFNAVCDPDTNTKALRVVAQIGTQLGVPVINHPDAVMASTRDRLGPQLAGIDGLRVPWTVRVAPRYVRDVEQLIEQGELPPPFLFREAGCHGGEKLVLVEDGERLDELERFAFDGRSFYVSEFVDFRSADGLYRKHRIMVVDNVPYPKHLIVSDHWNIHAESRNGLMRRRPDLVAEEAAFLESFRPSDHPALEAVAERLTLDFFGIDCSIADDGTVLIFEANGCMRALPGTEKNSRFASHQTSTAELKAAMAALVTRKAARQAPVPGTTR